MIIRITGIAGAAGPASDAGLSATSFGSVAGQEGLECRAHGRIADVIDCQSRLICQLPHARQRASRRV